MRHFNTTGPIIKDDHYYVEPLQRWDMSEIMNLIENKKYFLLHAPRQTGKTTCLFSLREKLNEDGDYYAVYTNLESATAFREDVEKVNYEISYVLLTRASRLNIENFDFNKALAYLNNIPKLNCFGVMLSYLSELLEKPVVVFIDEIDALVGDSLLNVLNQLRSGYTERPKHFPHSVMLCGLRNVKDYRLDSINPLRLSSGSPFNVLATSLRLGNFSKEEVKDLYGQHTNETGQIFADGCVDMVMDYTSGQPWLVNAIAYELITKMKLGENLSIKIIPDMINQAKERIILSRQTHLDQLSYRLGEERVQRVIAPMLNGENRTPNQDDTQYCLDLGLIKKNENGIIIANKIYLDIIPRELSSSTQDFIFSTFTPNWIKPDGYIDIKIILSQFKDFWDKNSSIWGVSIAGYHEAAPQLVLQAFLQRVVNGGGSVIREFALGSYRSDFLIEWRVQGKIQNIVIELKMLRKNDKYETVRNKAIEQTNKYVKMCGQKTAEILIFDRDSYFNWGNDDENETVEYDNVHFEIWKLGSGILNKLVN